MSFLRFFPLLVSLLMLHYACCHVEAFDVGWEIGEEMYDLCNERETIASDVCARLQDTVEHFFDIPANKMLGYLHLTSADFGEIAKKDTFPVIVTNMLNNALNMVEERHLQTTRVIAETLNVHLLAFYADLFRDEEGNLPSDFDTSELPPEALYVINGGSSESDIEEEQQLQVEL